MFLSASLGCAATEKKLGAESDPASQGDSAAEQDQDASDEGADRGRMPSKLAIDLGGLHRALRQSVDLDASAAKLGIARGQRYDMDIFHAERMAVESNFRIETTIDCLIPAELL